MRAQGARCKAVAQLVILYNRESWVLTREMLKVLAALHHRAARRITGLTEKHGAGGEWEYPLVEDAMEATGIHLIRVYIKRIQPTIAERVSCCPVYTL